MGGGHCPSGYQPQAGHGEWRCAKVRNVDAWYAAFDVKPGQKMFLAPVTCVKIW